MAAMTVSNMTNLYNRLSGDRLVEGINKQVPILGVAKKKGGFGGEGKYHVVQYGVGAGQSAVFSTAQANKSEAAVARFFITRAREFALASIDNESYLASKGDKFAVANLMKVAIDNATLSGSRSLGIHAYRGGGYRSQMASISGAGPYDIVLSTLSDASLFTPGMKIQANTQSDGSGTLRANALTITKVNVTAGTLTVTGTTTGWTANDYIAREGDFGQCITGLGLWIPSSTPGTLFGQDRTVAPEYLGGSRLTYSGTVSDAIIDGATQTATLGGSSDVAFVPPAVWATLSKEIGTKERITVASTMPGGKAGTVGYDALAVYAGTGRVEVIADPNCPANKIFLGKKDTLELWYLEELFGSLNKLMGAGPIVEQAADAIEIRMGGYMQMVVTEPWHWANITLS